MLKVLLAAFLAAVLSYAAVEAQETGSRVELFDKTIVPLVQELQYNPAGIASLSRAVRRFNEMRAAVPKVVADMEPPWLMTQMRGAAGAALSLCGAELRSCDKAREYLLEMTAQCSTLFLGIVDLAKYPDMPRQLYGATDPNLILLLRMPGEEALTPISLLGIPNPDLVAVVMCPTESHTFGQVLRPLTIPLGK